MFERIKSLFTKGRPKKNIATAAFSSYNYKQIQALQISTAYACVKVIAESAAMLPLKIYHMNSDGEKELAINHPLYDIFEYSPNPNDTPAEFKEKILVSLIMNGNSFCEIERAGLGNSITALWVIPYESMECVRMTNGSVRYRWYDLKGQLQEANSYDRTPRVWHIKLFSTDNVKGVSPIEQLKDTLKMAGMTEQFWTQFLENGCTLSGKLKMDDVLTDDAFEEFKKRFEETYKGINNIGKYMILENGMDFTPISTNSLADSQFVETKTFIMKQVASIFKVPLHMIGIMEASTYNNVEQQQIFFLVHCLGPYLKKIEERVEMLFDREERREYSCKFLTSTLLKMDMKTRFTVYRMAIEDGILSRNECRDMEDMHAYTGGDKFIVPLNMAVINEQGQIERIVTSENSLNGTTDTADKDNPNSGSNNDADADNRKGESDEQQFNSDQTV